MATIKVNPTGTHIQHGFLKGRVDIFPGPTDRSYPIHYVDKPVIPLGGYPGEVDARGNPVDREDYIRWLRSLPTIKVLNPMFCHFVKINPNTTLTNLEAEIERILTPDVLASADAFLAENSKVGFHKFAKLMRDSTRLGNGLVLPKGYSARGLIVAANRKFANLRGELDGGGSILDIKAGTIDVGDAATDRGTQAALANAPWISKGNPANGTGAITSIEMWALTSDLVNCEVANFIDEGSDVLSTRDFEVIGTVTFGSKQTFSGKDMNVATGDYIGTYWDGGGWLEADDSGGSGVWYGDGTDYIPCTSQAFTAAAGWAISLYGTGEESAPVAGGAGEAAKLLSIGQI